MRDREIGVGDGSQVSGWDGDVEPQIDIMNTGGRGAGLGVDMSSVLASWSLRRLRVLGQGQSELWWLRSGVTGGRGGAGGGAGRPEPEPDSEGGLPLGRGGAGVGRRVVKGDDQKHQGR